MSAKPSIVDYRQEAAPLQILPRMPLLSSQAMAAALYISQYYFCRLFKQSTGISPHRYLMQQRIDRAKQLLRLPKLTVITLH